MLNCHQVPTAAECQWSVVSEDVNDSKRNVHVLNDVSEAKRNVKNLLISTFIYTAFEWSKVSIFADVALIEM